MIRLLFISHTGNNEPPMAQCIMDHLIQKAGLTDSLSVSAASFAKEGAPLSKAAQETLSAHGIPYTMKKTFPIAWKTYDDYDFILLMNDKNNPDIFNTPEKKPIFRTRTRALPSKMRMKRRKKPAKVF